MQYAPYIIGFLALSLALDNLRLRKLIPNKKQKYDLYQRRAKRDAKAYLHHFKSTHKNRSVNQELSIPTFVREIISGLEKGQLKKLDSNKSNSSSNSFIIHRVKRRPSGNES